MLFFLSFYLTGGKKRKKWKFPKSTVFLKWAEKKGAALKELFRLLEFFWITQNFRRFLIPGLTIIFFLSDWDTLKSGVESVSATVILKLELASFLCVCVCVCVCVTIGPSPEAKCLFGCHGYKTPWWCGRLDHISPW